MQGCIRFSRLGTRVCAPSRLTFVHLYNFNFNFNFSFLQWKAFEVLDDLKFSAVWSCHHKASGFLAFRTFSLLLYCNPLCCLQVSLVYFCTIAFQPPQGVSMAVVAITKAAWVKLDLLCVGLSWGTEQYAVFLLAKWGEYKVHWMDFICLISLSQNDWRTGL